MFSEPGDSFRRRRAAVSTTAFTLLVLTLTAVASARPEGLAQACNSCHERPLGPTASLSIDGMSLEPSQTVDLVLGLRSNVAGSVVTGAWLQADKGEFDLLEPDTTKLAPPNGVLHSEPRPLVDSAAQFTYRWTAPAEVGITTFTVWAITGNSNGTSTDDNYSNTLFYAAHGCEGESYYEDLDGDGFGADALRVFTCDGPPSPSHITVGGDCDDESEAVSPAMQELCNLVDDNCDGAIDEGFMPSLLYPDNDGDGYAASRGTPVYGCEEPGYAAELGDCADSNPMVNPAALEVENGIDDNCDGQVDEGVSPAGSSGSMGMGGAMTAGAAPVAGQAGTAVAPVAASGGCCFVGGKSPPWSWGPWLTLVISGLTLARLRLSRIGSR